MSVTCCTQSPTLCVTVAQSLILRHLFLFYYKFWQFLPCFCAPPLNIPFHLFAQPSKNPIRVQDLKILCAENEQTRTCWTSAFRLFKVLFIFMQETPCLSFYFPCVLTTVLCAVSTGSSFSVTMRCPKQLHKKWKDPN